jgi:CRISPR/Cas system-associated exonuclease Cas4 (RecB family)
MESLAKSLGSTFRDPDTIVSRVARHLMVNEEVTDRRSDVVHPSEASHEGWCPRAVYYRIAGVAADPSVRPIVFELALETGSDAHRKWQSWLWEMGLLRGMWTCLRCELFWEAVSPFDCPRCEANKQLIRYSEVPVSNEKYLLHGNADGDVWFVDGWKLIEIKTIGTGTVRIEAPNMMKRFSYTHKGEDGKDHEGVDWQALWRSIRRPFPSHLRQGMIYCFLRGRKEIVYIYDPKFITAYPKEFEIGFRKDLIEDILDECIWVKDALEKQRPPKRPMWAEVKHKTCQGCPYHSTCWSRALHDRSNGKASSGSDSGAEDVGTAGSRAARPARIRFTAPASQLD